MDLFPLYNSLRISLVSTVLVFFLGIFVANLVLKMPRIVKALSDVVFTVPMVLPPTVVGYLLLLVIGPNRAVGSFFLNVLHIRLTMGVYGSILACVLVTFPLMYRSALSAFEDFDHNIRDIATILGISKTSIFWHLVIPYSKNGLIAGIVLSFLRAVGEYGATSMVSGYIPGKTATISTTVYQLWQLGDDANAIKWVIINLVISFVMLIALNIIGGKFGKAKCK